MKKKSYPHSKIRTVWEEEGMDEEEIKVNFKMERSNCIHWVLETSPIAFKEIMTRKRVFVGGNEYMYARSCRYFNVSIVVDTDTRRNTVTTMPYATLAARRAHPQAVSIT